MEHKFLAFILHENDVFTWKVHEKNIELGQVLKKVDQFTLDWTVA